VQGVHLGRKAPLQMNGFSITGGDVGVLCRKGCAVDGGGGEISGQGDQGIWYWSRGVFELRDVTIHDTGVAVAMAFFARKLEVTDVTVHDSLGILAGDVDIEATNLDLVGTGLGCGLGGAFLAGRNVRGSNISANIVDADRNIEITGLTVNADCGWGVVARRGAVELTDSSVTGASEADVISRRPPVLTNTTCDTSRMIDRSGTLGGTWGVRAND
jgi:hypothetical protein